MMLRILSFVTLFVAASCQFKVTPGPNVTLVTYLVNSSVVSTEPKESFSKREVNKTHHVSIYCNLNGNPSGSTVSVKWLMNNKELTVADRGRDDRVIQITTTDCSGGNCTSTLTVKQPESKHAASYRCEFSIGSSTVNSTVCIESPPIIESFSKAKRAIQGDKLKIACKLHGFPLPESVTWYFGNRSHELTFREGLEAVADENGVQDAIIRFTSLKFEDRGIYWCSASNRLGEDTAGVLVRAKNRLDALWPFLGIVAEVAILVTLILVYEKKRSGARQPAEPNGVVEPVLEGNEEPGEGPREDRDRDQDDDVRQRPARV